MALEPPSPESDAADGDAILARALQAARDEAPADWPAIADTVMRRVRETVPPAYSLLVRELPDGSRSYVSTRVVSEGVRRVLTREPTHAPSGIRLRLEDDRLVGVDLALVAAYGVDLLALSARVRADVVTEVATLTGLPPLPLAEVAIDVVDVVDGDPRVV